MRFPDSYFEDEVREGFYIPSLMKRCWAAQMEVLEIVGDICKKHHIRYFAEWGTLLGAVRHKGRIPWDDDIDICMLREDYDKFCRIAGEELPEECQFFDPHTTEGFNQVLGRVINSRTHVVEGALLEKYHGFPYVAGIDIFWLDDLPGGKEVTNSYIWVNRKDYRLPRECYETGILLPFENTQIMVPSHYDKILSKKYGDWKTPIRSGGLHDYPSYAKQQRFLEQEQAAELFEYKFSWKDREKILPVRESKVSLQDRLCDFIPLLQTAHDEILRALRNENRALALEMLGECQETAIQLGMFVEKEQGERHLVVQRLEQYCETLFQLYTQIQESAGPDVLLAADCGEKLSAVPEDLAHLIQDEIHERKEIIFVPYKASLWETMGQEWQKAVKADDADVYIIPAPFYYKDDYGRVKTETPHYETKGYPESATVLSYEDYDFQGRHPDCIVIQCPYDEYHYGMTLHPFFYAKNLVKYTDRLVYIPALVPDAPGPGEQRTRESLKSYCNMPGVVYADQVVVPSARMKDVYVELLTEFAGEDSGKYWEEKITSSDAS